MVFLCSPLIYLPWERWHKKTRKEKIEKESAGLWGGCQKVGPLLTAARSICLSNTAPPLRSLSWASWWAQGFAFFFSGPSLFTFPEMVLKRRRKAKQKRNTRRGKTKKRKKGKEKDTGEIVWALVQNVKRSCCPFSRCAFAFLSLRSFFFLFICIFHRRVFYFTVVLSGCLLTLTLPYLSLELVFKEDNRRRTK